MLWVKVYGNKFSYYKDIRGPASVNLYTDCFKVELVHIFWVPDFIVKLSKSVIYW